MASPVGDPGPPGERDVCFPGAWGDLAEALVRAERLLCRAEVGGLPAADAQGVRRRLASALVVARRDVGAAMARVSEIIEELTRRVARD